MRLYVSNDSYPELREIHSRWQRHLIWWRAFASGFHDRRFWYFAVSQLMVLGAALSLVILAPDSVPPAYRGLTRGVVLVVAVVFSGFISLTWGGDLMRPHLRRVSAIARSACPRCGHQLTGHLESAQETIRCPECAAHVPVGLFDPPHRIPREFLSVSF